MPEIKTDKRSSPVKKRKKSLLFDLEEQALMEGGLGGEYWELKAAEEQGGVKLIRRWG